MKKSVTIVFLLLLFTLLVSRYQINLVKAEGTVYIREDGTVEGTTKITQEGNLYTFTGDVFNPIIVERDNIVIDGKGYSIEEPDTSLSQSPNENAGILLDRLGYITIHDLSIQHPHNRQHNYRH
jgi:hypothetical protein